MVVGEIRHLKHVFEPNWLDMVFACAPKIEQLALVAIWKLIKNNPMVDCYQDL